MEAGVQYLPTYLSQTVMASLCYKSLDKFYYDYVPSG